MAIPSSSLSQRIRNRVLRFSPHLGEVGIRCTLPVAGNDRTAAKRRKNAAHGAEAAEKRLPGRETRPRGLKPERF